MPALGALSGCFARGLTPGGRLVPAAIQRAPPRTATLRVQARGGGGRGKGSKGGKEGGKGKPVSKKSGKPAGYEAGNKAAEQKAKPSLKADLNPYAGPPLDTIVTEVLQEPEKAPEPWWSTFTGHCAGTWFGNSQAFNPVTADVELVAKAGKEKLFAIPSVCHVTRDEGGDADTPSLRQRLLGVVPMSSSASNEKGTASPEEDSNDQEALAPESEVMDYTEPGLVYFNDGSYSRGPMCVGMDMEENVFGEKEAIIQIETCMALTGEQRRARIFQTLQFIKMDTSELSEEDLADLGEDVPMQLQLLRVSVVNEHWAGPCDSELAKPDPKHDNQEEGKRVKLKSGIGAWKVFSMEVMPLAKEDWELDLQQESAAPGTSRPYHLEYSTSETKQDWEAADQFYDKDDCSVLSLPGGIMPYVKMGAIEGSPALSIGVSWRIKKDLQYDLCRDYNDDGDLMNVRMSTCIRGDWKGGSMNDAPGGVV